ncbi:predicted protein [Histoplasma mississippiense (nom. inval.)]|uniref:predicted protein n=1 Tax=Ajellomyces capsulatus (strain NAm1 / WU24) TaxID=2059318 RepID=UPI000157C533|nr:predicted protein [Histoplasma mississippiense (nom. inval.)]EDN08262.1 predicted protein [Histoplasma mississippiense (nom. inval.)]
MSALQESRGTEQAASRRRARRTTEREVWKKESDDSIRRERGRQFWKVELPRKLWKKPSQAGFVKLDPRLLSKGLGKGVSSEDVMVGD